MPATATAEQIREAYRRQARRHHPDRTGGRAPSTDSAATMAAINEANRVLGDPGRRAAYDLARREPARSATRPSTTVSRPFTPPVDPTPAHYPWKLVIGMGVVGAAFVLAAAAFTGSSPPPPPDNVLQAGSCVVIEPNGTAREVTCAGEADDLNVRALVTQVADCDADTTPYRDSQGLGFACVEPVPAAGQ